MYRFFVEPEQIEESCVRITGGDVNHIRNVLRMRAGEELLVCCGDEWEYTCRITGFEDGEVRQRFWMLRSRARSCPQELLFFSAFPKGTRWS